MRSSTLITRSGSYPAMVLEVAVHLLRSSNLVSLSTAVVATAASIGALPVSAALVAWLGTVGSFAAHEAAHLWMLRRSTGVPGRLVRVPMGFAAEPAPGTSADRPRTTALLGPLAGLASCWLCSAFAGHPSSTSAVALAAAVHVHSLTPVALDGRVLWGLRATPRTPAS